MKINSFFLPVPLIFLFFCGACASKSGPITAPFAVEKPAEREERSWIITDYKNRENETPLLGENRGGEETVPSLPPWLSAFLNGGNREAEALEEFGDEFVFVAVNSGTNANALKQWQEGFSPELDFPRLAAVRIENCFLAFLTGYPDDEYGSYFETLVRAASDLAWQGAVRRDDFWLKRRFTDDDGEAGGAFPSGAAPVSGEIYDFFVLLTVEKPLLVPQINSLLSGIKPDPPLTRGQGEAVNRASESFYDFF